MSCNSLRKRCSFLIELNLLKFLIYNLAIDNYINKKAKQRGLQWEKNYYTYTPTLIYTYYLVPTYFAKCQLFSTFFVVKYNPVSQYIYILSFIIYNFPPADTYVVVWCFFNNFSKKYHPKHKKKSCSNGIIWLIILLEPPSFNGNSK